MTHDLLSEGERKFIIDGIRTNVRNDGRQRLDVDSFSIELNILPYCVCSAKAILHSTQVIVGLKLEVCEPHYDAPSKGKIQCSVRYSPCSAPWKRNYELESMNFDLSRELQNILSNSNGINLNDLCIIKNRLCWVIYVDALILENHGNVFDALCLASNACFKNLVIPSLKIKNLQQYTQDNTDNDNKTDTEYVAEQTSLFTNTEITKKAAIFKRKKKQKQKISKFSGQQLPFQDSIALTASVTEQKHSNTESRTTQQNEVGDMAQIEFVIEQNVAGQQLDGMDKLPIVVTMAIMDNNRYFVMDPLFEEELCCDVLIRIAVHCDGNICIIKYGEKAIDPLLIFNMMESAKQCGLRWMEELSGYLSLPLDVEMETDLDVFELSAFELSKEEEKKVEMEMNEQLKKLSFVTESLRKEENGHICVDDGAEEGVEGGDGNKSKRESGKEEMDEDGEGKEGTKSVVNINEPVSKINADKSLFSTNIENVEKDKTLPFLKDASDDNSDDNDEDMIIVD